MGHMHTAAEQYVCALLVPSQARELSKEYPGEPQRICLLGIRFRVKFTRATTLLALYVLVILVCAGCVPSR